MGTHSEKITERTLYPLLLEIFKDIGFTGVQEIKVAGRRYPDLKISYKDTAFYVQVKIGKLDNIRDILTDISKLVSNKVISDINGFIGIKFDENIRNVKLITGHEEEVLKTAIENSKVYIIVSGSKNKELLFHMIDGNLEFKNAKKELINKIREFIDETKTIVNPESIVRVLKEYIDELAYILRLYYLSSPEALINLVGDISLFKSLLGLSESENLDELLRDEDFRTAVVDLLAFILTNQILFYYLYSNRSNKELPKLERITSLLDLKRYFNEITKIDFRAIYSINIFERLPNDKRILEVINNIIDVLNSNPIWKIPHDLLGRVYHKLLPFKTRKVFATFYTHPIAAEILARLTIDNYQESVIDPACGSGTLLVASYNTKKDLYRKYYGFISVEDDIKLHRQFVERDISGIDIMPFAAHIAAMNLSLQNIDAETNRLRISVDDSINILKRLLENKGRQEYLVLETVSSELIKVVESLKNRQTTLDAFFNGIKRRNFNITIYVYDTEHAKEYIISNKIDRKVIYVNNNENIEDINYNQIAILGISKNNLDKLINILKKLENIKDKFRNLTLNIVVDKNLSEEVISIVNRVFYNLDTDVKIKTIDVFTLTSADSIIMNPPFSDREKLPEEYREKLNQLNYYKFIKENVGGQINLWGYFLALSHFLLKSNCKVGAVIPINIARGKATEKIRKFFLKNYHIRWLVKPVADLAFSEAAAFRDILFIAEKRKPKEDDITGIVFIKKSIRSSEFTTEEAKRIVDELKLLYKKAKEGEINHYEDPDGFYEVYFVNYKTLIEHQENLMPLLKETGLEEDLMEVILERAGEKLERLDESYIRQGFHTSPAGLSELVYITRPLDKSRIGRNVIMVLHSEDSAFIYVVFKDKIKDLLKNFSGNNLEEFIKNHTKPDLKIPKDRVLPGLRTITGIKTIDITNKHDYIVIEDFMGFDKVVLMSKWKDKSLAKDPTTRRRFWDLIKKKLENQLVYTATPEKFNIYSINTSVICVVSKVKTIYNQTFRVNTADNIIFSLTYTLSFNSILGLTQVIRRISEATGEFVHLSTKDLETIYILDSNKLSDQEKQVLLNLFKEIKDIEFPSIMEQMKKGYEYIKHFKDKSWEDLLDYTIKNDPGMYARIKLDYTILKIVGFNEDEIKDLLEKTYKTIYEELIKIKSAK
ncbi:N-6 DNA methylase [Methanocaldococcus villosus KIN24-T80]|uniref:site-specific DNA-methyltransferase (adenine-specific) n=1 Tax=Methanocaldococcus villosus KIN24-T80 TaxID=1069083 RepID=N6V180_9EURY|nr:N-6 DNA methylase [Methanocaldococcus villosus]ENN96038.1 N-6 DNA methylase [Methanocaldococcus villosus KIN24-T80]